MTQQRPARASGAALLRGGGGAPGAALRALLTPVALGYGMAMALRNAAFASGAAGAASLDRPVVSVGNLTTGGTGKTPCTFWILEWARRRGRELAILTRGHGGRGGENDEVAMARERFPGVAVGVGRDRVASARVLLTQGHRIDGFVLDDGFQHRRVRRDLDLCLVDATDPFGGGACLPAGLLREPRRGVRRSDVVILTRADQVPPDARHALWRELTRLGYRGPEVEARHAPVRLEPIDPRGDPRPVEALRGMAVHALSGIGHPGSFERTLRELGAEVASHRVYPDHHAYSPADLPDLRGEGGSLWCTTEKDAVKLRRLGVIDGWCLRVGFSIERGRSELEALLERAFHPR